MSAQNGTPMIVPSRRDPPAKWLQCTSRLESCVTLDEVASKLVDAVGQVLGATGAVLYLADPGDGGLRAAAAVGTGCPAPTLADDDHAPFVPLRWRDEPIGALVLGEPVGNPYSPDDLELMAAIGEEAAGLLVAAQLSES